MSGFYTWSRTAASNASADGACPWPEGMAPSQVNDSARGMMASVAKWRDDIAGIIPTTGTSTAYAASSFQGYTSLDDASGQMIAFVPHITNGGAVTLAIDGLAAKPVRSAFGVDIPSGVLIAGTPYTATYFDFVGEWILHGFFGNPYNIPLGSGLDYWGTTAPSSAFAFPTGQAISRTTYATLFTLIGTTYGTGDGSTTFNLPDKTGRVSAMKEATATRLTTAAVGVDGATLGATGAGGQTLVTANLPPYTPSGSVSATVLNLLQSNSVAGSGSSFWGNGGVGTALPAPSFTGVAQGGTSTPFKVVQPTIICNYIIRII